MKVLAIAFLLLHSVILSAQERITLLFVGDLMQHQAQIDAARQPDGSYDYTPCFASVKELIKGADIAIGNLEVTLGGTPYRGYPAFSAPDEYLLALRDAGFDLLLTANNHCLDRGKKGLERTIRLLDSLQIAHAGTYRDERERQEGYPLLVRAKGFRIVFLNYTYGTNGIRVSPPNIVNYIDKEVILEDLRRSRACRPDAIIACMHWGEEYQSLPNREQKELAEWLLQQGVTHIIGSHPHVIQPMELRKRGMEKQVVVYSLGNFISNMSAPRTDGGLVFTLQLEKLSLPAPIPPRYQDRSLSPLFSDSLMPDACCRVAACSYQLVWTARPTLTGEKNFKLLPVSTPADSLTPAARNRLKIFTEDARKLLRQHNIGIYEEKK